VNAYNTSKLRLSRSCAPETANLKCSPRKCTTRGGECSRAHFPELPPCTCLGLERQAMNPWLLAARMQHISCRTARLSLCVHLSIDRHVDESVENGIQVFPSRKAQLQMYFHSIVPSILRSFQKSRVFGWRSRHSSLQRTCVPPLQKCCFILRADP
jgi:hypothetical protein